MLAFAFLLGEYWMMQLFSEKRQLICAGLVITGAFFVGQSSLKAQDPAPPVQPVNSNETPTVQQRLNRARALAAAHNLNAAAVELDAIRTTTTDTSVRDVARLLLMNIYLEQSDQGRSFQLLDDAFAGRSSQDEGTSRLYFALAGQVVKSTRERIDRYREFGFSVTDKDLPADAVNDLNRLRLSLEKVILQAKNIADDNPRGTDALALLEDASMVRCGLARNDDERDRWHNECTLARAQLAESETRISTLSNTDPSQRKAELARQAQATNGTWSKPVIDPDLARDAVASNSAAVRPAPTIVKTAIVRSKNDPAEVSNVGSLFDQATKKVAPAYPTVAKSARITGVVRVEIVVDENGNIAEVKGATGPESLRTAATDAARRWKFRPMVVDGQKVRVAGYLTFNFTL
jgi:TonB family protein